MIPVAQIIPENLYSQDDAEFLLGDGFTTKAAREVICEACRSGQLPSTQWRKRYWFTGQAFLEWVRRWFGNGLCAIDQGLVLDGHPRYDGATDPEPVAGEGKGGR